MQAVQSLLGGALVEHPGSVYLHIMVARYLLMFRSNDYLALAHLKIARVRSTEVETGHSWRLPVYRRGTVSMYTRGAETTCFCLLLQQHALKGLAMPRPSNSGVALASGWRGTSPLFRACGSASPFCARYCHSSQKPYIRRPQVSPTQPCTLTGGIIFEACFIVCCDCAWRAAVCGMQLCQPAFDFSMTITRLEQLIARNSSEGKVALSARIKFDQLHGIVKGAKLQASEKRVSCVNGVMLCKPLRCC